MLQLHNHIPRSFLVINVIRERLYAHPVEKCEFFKRFHYYTKIDGKELYFNVVACQNPQVTEQQLF